MLDVDLRDLSVRDELAHHCRRRLHRGWASGRPRRARASASLRPTARGSAAGRFPPSFSTSAASGCAARPRVRRRHGAAAALRLVRRGRRALRRRAQRARPAHHHQTRRAQGLRTDRHRHGLPPRRRDAVRDRGDRRHDLQVDVEEHRGWADDIRGVRRIAELPAAARALLDRHRRAHRRPRHGRVRRPRALRACGTDPPHPINKRLSPADSIHSRARTSG